MFICCFATWNKMQNRQNKDPPVPGVWHPACLVVSVVIFGNIKSVNSNWHFRNSRMQWTLKKAHHSSTSGTVSRGGDRQNICQAALHSSHIICTLGLSLPPHLVQAHSLHFFLGSSRQKSQSGLFVPKKQKIKTQLLGYLYFSVSQLSETSGGVRYRLFWA